MSKKKDKIRIEFNVHLQMLRDVPKNIFGTEIFIECHRGKKTKNFRCTDNKMVNQANVQIDTKYKWELGLFQNMKTNPPTFEPKKQLSFSIKQFPQGSKKAVTWGKATYELSTHANHGTIRTEILEITKEKKDKTDTTKTNLVIKLEVKWADKSAKPTPDTRQSKIDDKNDHEEDDEEPTSDNSDDRDTRKRRDTPRGKDKETSKDRELKDRRESMRPGHKPMIEQLSDLEDDDLDEDEDVAPKSRRDKDKQDKRDRNREDSEEEEFTPSRNNANSKSKDKEPVSSKVSREKETPKETPKDSKDKKDSRRIAAVESDEDKDDAKSEEPEDAPPERLNQAEMEVELDDLRRDKQRLEKRVERLVKDLEEAKQKLIEEQQKNAAAQSTPTTKSNSGAPNEVDDLKRDKQRLERKSEKQTKEIAELKEALVKANEDAKNGAKRDRVSTVGGRRTLELEMEDQSKQISDLTAKLKAASQTSQDIFQATINYIERNSVDNNSNDPTALVFWLNYTTETFRIIYSETKTFDKKAFMKSLDEPDFDIDDLDPVPKFLHQLIRTSFDIFAAMVRNAYSLFEPYIESFVIDQKAPKKQEQALSNFTNHIQESLAVIKTCSSRVQEAFLDQLFAFMDAQLFNCLMKKTNLFRCNSGFQIKMLLSKIESVCSKTLKQLNLNVALSHDHLGFIKEAATMLVMDKSIMGDEETRKQIFTKLNILQISYIMKYFEPDDSAPDPIPEKVKRAIEAASAQAQRRNDSVKLELDPTDIKRVNLCFNT